MCKKMGSLGWTYSINREGGNAAWDLQKPDCRKSYVPIWGIRYYFEGK